MVTFILSYEQQMRLRLHTHMHTEEEIVERNGIQDTLADPCLFIVVVEHQH